MTKEEYIWDKFMGKGDFASLSIHNKSLVKGILSAYSKQQAVAFGAWLNQHLYIPNDTLSDIWNKLYDPNIFQNTEYLHTQFIEQQNKDNA